MLKRNIIIVFILTILIGIVYIVISKYQTVEVLSKYWYKK